MDSGEVERSVLIDPPLQASITARYRPCQTYLTQSVLKVVLQSQLPHKFVNLFLVLVIAKDTLEKICEN